MKAISLTQPWASLVAYREKQIETRSWATAYRGPIAIHASANFPRWARELVLTPPFLQALSRHAQIGRGFITWNDLPVGAVIATAELEWCAKIDRDWEFLGCGTNERAFGDYTYGRYAWGFSNVTMLPTPRPAKGALGLWEWFDKVDWIDLRL